MTKEFLLAKSHFRKNKGSSIGIFCLMFLSAMLLCLAMILFTDTYPTAKKEAKRLDSGDGLLYVSSQTVDENTPELSELLSENTARMDVYKTLYCRLCSVPFGETSMITDVQLETLDKAAKKTMSRTEIVTEDPFITSDYIYLPYQFKTSGVAEIGDNYNITLFGETYHFTIKGFLNSVYGGCNNCGLFEMAVSEDTYAKLLSQAGENSETTFITYALKENVKPEAFRIKVMNGIKMVDPAADIHMVTIENTLSGRSFMSLIIAGSFLAVTMIVMIVIILMIVNSISNYIKENMKTIGALKAIGYTGKNIKVSMLLMFLALALVASTLGVLCSYLVTTPIANVVIAQMGVPYTVSFSLVSTVSAFAAVILLTFLVTILSLLKINKIQPIVALREGVQSHNFRTNHVPLDKTFLGLNAGLSIKTMLHNKRQNIITFFVMGFLVFLCVIALLMYENFNRNPKVDLMTNETCSGIVGFDKDAKVDGEEYLATLPGVKNIRRSYEGTVYVGEDNSLWVNTYTDPTKKNNKNECYKGRLPSHDNEINVSGLFAKKEGYEIGDEITVTLGDQSFTYLICGLIQTTNNGGSEAVLSEAGYAHICDLASYPVYLYFDTEKDEQIDPVIDACKDKFGEHVITTANFPELIDANMTTFRGIATLMLISVCSISALVILLVLFLLIRSLIFAKRKDYGIYKAIGYTSGNLILQTAGSFMPAIILSVIIYSIVSYFVANPYMNIIMINFGLMKCTFNIPIPGILIIGAAMILLSFVFAVFEARKIRKIEAYQMLVAE